MPLSPGADLLLPSVAPDQPIYRIGRAPNPWRAPDWSHANEDGTFGNRFDDSQGYFRVVYAGSTRLSCFLETLARYRKPPFAQQLSQALAAIENSPSDHIALGTVPRSWLGRRRIGTAALSGGRRFADIYTSEWLSFLRRELEPTFFTRTSIGGTALQFDLALLLSQDRSLTQRAATLVYELGYDGIRYQSRHGAELYNWAVFEPFHLNQIDVETISPTDPDFRDALERLDLRLDHRS